MIMFTRPWWLLAFVAVPWIWWVALASTSARARNVARDLPNRSWQPRSDVPVSKQTRNAGARLDRFGRLQGRSNQIISAVIRTGVITAIIFGLSGLTLNAEVKAVATVFLVDRSASIPSDVQAASVGFVISSMDARGPDDLAAVVSFGRSPWVELPLSKADVRSPGAALAGRVLPIQSEAQGAVAKQTRTIDERTETSGRAYHEGATDIGRAIAMAGALLPPAEAGYLRRVVVLTDGNETQGSAQAASRTTELRGVEIASVAAPGHVDDAAIASFDVAANLRDGEEAEARMVIVAPAPIRAVLHIWARAADQSATGRGTLVTDRTLELEQGPSEFAVSLGKLARGAWAFEAELVVTNDPILDNNVSWAHTLVGDPARVLIVEGEIGNASLLASTLRDATIITRTIAPADAPEIATDYANYDCIVLANVPASALSTAAMTAIREAVGSQGRGLIVAGGEQTFGQGEYTGSPLEEALPVTVQLPEKDQAATLAIVIVIDRSGSMSGIDTRDRRASRMDLAKEGAILAVETLKEGDQIGVVSFDYNARWVSEVRPIRGPTDIKAVADRIATIQPDGGTDIYLALDLAYRGMQTVQARVKHVILLTDGEGTPAPFPTLLNAYRRANITLSTVGVSSEAGRTLLQDLARRGSGRYYFTDTASGVPQIMTQEARLAGRAHKQERDFTPRLASSAPAVRNLIPRDLPPVHGYMRTSPRPGAEIVLTSDQEETLLAQWQYGLGRAIVWTADLEGAWSRDWVERPEAFRTLWVQAVRWTLSANRSKANLAVQIKDLPTECLADPKSDQSKSIQTCAEHRAQISVDAWATGGGFTDLATITADVVSPTGVARTIVLRQAAPGSYVGSFDADATGVSFVRVVQTDRVGTVQASEITGYAPTWSTEYAPTLGNRTLLERLAADSGAPPVGSPADAWRRDTVHGRARRDVWPELLQFAAVLFVVDVAFRRLRPTWGEVVVGTRVVGRLARVPVRWTWRAWDWFVAGQGVSR